MKCEELGRASGNHWTWHKIKIPAEVLEPVEM
jgi:hypothetical protein